LLGDLCLTMEDKTAFNQHLVTELNKGVNTAPGYSMCMSIWSSITQ